MRLKNLSGEEIKRVSVGIGMISNPNVLYLDESITGLDWTPLRLTASSSTFLSWIKPPTWW